MEAAIKKAKTELDTARKCTLNLKSDTDVLDRAIVARKKLYEKTVAKHQQTAERVGKVFLFLNLFVFVFATMGYKLPLKLFHD